MGDSSSSMAGQVVGKQRVIQAEVKQSRATVAASSSGATQAGARRYPEPPFPKQHQPKPGEEVELDPAPMYDAPFYRGSGKLQDKVAIVTKATKAAVEKEGRRCLLISGDVRDRLFSRAAVAQVLREFGRLDVLVNNAAFQVHAARFEDLTDEHLDHTVKTNLYGYFYMAQACVEHVETGAAIVNTGSVTGLLGNKDLIDYSMTKGGIHAFTRSLASKLVGRGIRVNAVAPGPVWTPLNPSDKDAEKVADFGSHTSMKRPAQPEEIAPAYVFLASSHCSSFITGEILPIIGGYSGG